MTPPRVSSRTRRRLRSRYRGNYAIECDIQISADGEAMVFHDQTLERLTKGGGRSMPCRRPSSTRGVPRHHRPHDHARRAHRARRRPGGAAGRDQSRFDGDQRLVTRAAAGACELWRPRRADVVRSRADRGAAHARPAPTARHRRRAPLHPPRMEARCRRAPSARSPISSTRCKAARSSSPIRSRICRRRSRGWHGTCCACRC